MQKKIRVKEEGVCLAILGVSLLCSNPLAATTLSPGEAWNRIGMDNARKAPSFHSVNLVYTAEVPGSEVPAFYVFENDGHAGFMVVSADDRAPALLAAVEESGFDKDEMPPALLYWLDEYARQMGYVIETDFHSPEANGRKVTSSFSRENVAPICKTKWDQGNPYNQNAPYIKGRRAFTGCVATAMAQAMKVYDWPEQGVGANTYEYNGETYSMNFSEVTFDWGKMLDEYTYTVSASEKDAVALLMQACGYAVNMGYGVSSSGAVMQLVGNALYRNFGYAHNALLVRDAYPQFQWESMMYEEVAAGRPIIYSGQSPDETSHAFICDGYREDGMFHFNWGWGGAYDGYFRMSALDPHGVGTGGGSGSYNFNQDAVVNIAPKGTEGLPEYYPIYADGGFVIDLDENPGIGRQYSFSDGAILNDSAVRYYGMLGVLVMKDGVLVREWSGPSVTFDAFKFGSGLSGFSSFTAEERLAGLEPGEYMLYPGVKLRNRGWYRVPVVQGNNQYIRMTKNEDGSVTYSNESTDFLCDLEITSLSPEGQVLSAEDSGFLLGYRNGQRAFKGRIYLLTNSDDGVVNVSVLECDLSEESEGEMPVRMKIDLSPGTHKVWFASEDGAGLSDEFTIEVVEGAGVSLTDNDNEKGSTGFDLGGIKVSSTAKGIIVISEGEKRLNR